MFGGLNDRDMACLGSVACTTCDTRWVSAAMLGTRVLSYFYQCVAPCSELTPAEWLQLKVLIFEDIYDGIGRDRDRDRDWDWD